MQELKVVRPIKKPAPQKARDEKPEQPPAIERKPRAQKTAERTPVSQEASGYYLTKKGDSLFSIAASKDVYADPLKWPFLYRRNQEMLGKLPWGEAFADRELPEGLRLRILSPHEIKETLKTSIPHPWVVNVVSTTTAEELTPFALRLLRGGYPVYLSRVKVKGRQWVRLRVGFFNNRAEADAEGKKIMAMLNLADSWVSKIGKEEFGEFGGY